MRLGGHSELFEQKLFMEMNGKVTEGDEKILS
jgi:hypothetical protein